MKLLKWLWALVFAVLGFFLGKKSLACDEKKAQDARKKTEDKIEKIPASDLVNNAPNAGDLRRRKEILQSELRSELKDVVE